MHAIIHGTPRDTFERSSSRRQNRRSEALHSTSNPAMPIVRRTRTGYTCVLIEMRLQRIACGAWKQEPDVRQRDAGCVDHVSHTLKLVRKSPVHEYCGNQPGVLRPL